MSTVIYPGTFFTAAHMDIDTGKVVNHMFVAVYDQELDVTLGDLVKSNVIGCLITSNPTASNSRYSVSLTKRLYPFLKQDSVVHGDKVYVFNKDSIGLLSNSIAPIDFKDLLNCRDLYIKSENFQSNRSLGNLIEKESNFLKGFINKRKGIDD